MLVLGLTPFLFLFWGGGTCDPNFFVLISSCFAQNKVKPKTSISTSRQPRKLKFGMQAYFDPTIRNMNGKIGVT